MSQIRAVKDASDIVEVIGTRVSLQRSGTNWRGLCPFHSEKSPSFFVSEQMQRYRCFGCGKSGDVFTFLEDYEGMTFYEALELLAEQAGVTLEKTGPSGEDKERAEVLEVLDLAKEYYHYLLTLHSVGEPGRKYLKERHVSNESIKIFQLGFALDQWDGLIKFLHHKKKYPLDTLLAAGLVIKTQNGRYYDRFRSRVVFPLRNHRGQIVGFSGRILPGSEDKQAEKQAKYINSPETIVYHKSQLLYGFSELYQHIRQEKQVIVVEGEMDVIGSVQAHVNNTVAIKGSALTEQQVKLLSRTVDQVLLCLDADSAGVEATKKAIAVINNTEVSRQAPLELRVIRIPSGKDPDELSKEDPKLWRDTAKRSMTAYEFLIQVTFERNDSSTPQGKTKIMQDLVPIMAEITHAVELEHYIKVIAERLGVSNASVSKDIEQYRKNRKFGSTGEATQQTAKDSKPKPESRQQKLENYTWFLLLHSDAENILKRAEGMSQVNLKLLGAKIILETVMNHKGDTLQEIVAALPDDLQANVFQLYSQQVLLTDLESLDMAKEWTKALQDLRKESNRERTTEIQAELEKLDKEREKTPSMAAKQEELLRELVQLKQRAG